MMTVLIPDMSLSLSKKDLWSTEKRITQVLRISYLVGLGTLVSSLCISQNLGNLFYSRNDLGNMIKIAGLCSFLSYAAAASFGILNALGKQNMNLKNSIIVSTEGLILVFILTSIPSLNIYGYGVSIVLTSITGLLLNLYEIKKACDLVISAKRIVAYTMSGFIGFLAMTLVTNIMPDSLIAFDVLFSVGACFLVIFYLSKFFNRFKFL